MNIFVLDRLRKRVFMFSCASDGRENVFVLFYSLYDDDDDDDERERVIARD